jgi:hypothetical protein
VVLPEANVAELNVTELSVTGAGLTVTETERETPPYVAVICTVARFVGARAVMRKVPEVSPAAMVAWAGTEAVAVSLLCRVTTAPGEGAWPESEI